MSRFHVHLARHDIVATGILIWELTPFKRFKSFEPFKTF
jgi:hypothetical protein